MMPELGSDPHIPHLHQHVLHLSGRYDENFKFLKSSVSFTSTGVSAMRPEQGSDLHIPYLHQHVLQLRYFLLGGIPFGPFGPLQRYEI